MMSISDVVSKPVLEHGFKAVFKNLFQEVFQKLFERSGFRIVSKW